jgi:aspartate 1-decarboxylase
MLKSKIHRATLTGTELDYEGSIAIDSDLLEAADMLPGEQVHVLNVSNGSRLVTYTIAARAGSGTVMLNGPAARLGMAGDLVVILSYAVYPDQQARRLRPKVVKVDRRNRLKQG